MITTICYNRTNVLTPATLEAFGGMTKAHWRRFDMGILTRKICGIYKITNLVNGMAYIGQSRDIEKRWWSHKNGREKDHNYYIHNAIAKYGIEKFSFEILEECSIEKLNDLEIHYISIHNTTKPNGYNLDSGGNSHKELSLFTRLKMSLSKRGVKHNFYGTRRSDATKKKISRANSKSVNQYTLDGKYIRTFDSINDVKHIFEENERVSLSHISQCCLGVRRQALGYQWRYASDCRSEDIAAMRDRTPMTDDQRKKISLSKEIPVSQYTTDYVFIAKYESGRKASLATGVSWKNISQCCTGEKKTAGGFVWKYADDNN